MRRFLHAVPILLGLNACLPQEPERPRPSVTYRLRWHTAQRPAPSTSAAIVFFTGDAKLIDGAGASFLGRVIVRGGEGAKEASFEKAAAESAARDGGTHVMMVGEEDAEKEIGTLERTSSSGSGSCYSASCFASGSRATTTVKVTRVEKTRVFAIYAVDPDRWEDLPQQLRPRPAPPPSPAASR